MSSKKEEERNEKIIRGLMKLPPNRKCINCNSLGPQYVCTNFWTFICITCSGIHREFTHRVKSVSMAKFTSQEVDALQKGGNQRAREIYFIHWDPMRQKQPNSSNAEKVREFIKQVYVDKKYASGKTSDKPPREAQNPRHPEEETRRASSYHSFSQSPPYDYQYEERRYGKQLPALTRKPGSDKGLYEGKVSNFSSPSRFSDQTLEERFANEGSNPKASDYSVSSPGQSPNFRRDAEVRSPYQTSDNIAEENAERVRRTQRATSFSSFGPFDSNSMSFKSNNSVTLADLVSAPEQSSEIHQDTQYAGSSLPHSSSSRNFGGLDLFDTPFAPPTVTQSAAVDLFQLPEALSRAPMDLFEPSYTSSAPNAPAQKPTETKPSSLDFISQMPPRQPPPATMDKRSQNKIVAKNEGWATFVFTQHVPSNHGVVHSTPPGVPPNGGYIEKVDPLPMPSTGIQWPVFEDSTAHEPTSLPNLVDEPTLMHNLWHREPFKSQVSSTNTQRSWGAFEDPISQFSYSATHQSGQEVAGRAPFTTMDQHLGDLNQDAFARVHLDSRPPIPGIPLHVEAHSHVIERKSSNPFELSDDCDFESGSMFINMTSLQDALPSCQLPNAFVGDVTQSWFPRNPVPHYIPAAQPGGFMGRQAPSIQMPNVLTPEAVTSVGGNPFA